MSKVAIVYWSGTGNTEAMAKIIAETLQEQSIQVDIREAINFRPNEVENFDGFAFGCPAMGNEELEMSEFEPMFESVEDQLSGKPTVIFGSFSWNTGQWMEDWTDRCHQHGINLVADGLPVYDNPDEEGKKECQVLAKTLVKKLR